MLQVTIQELVLKGIIVPEEEGERDIAIDWVPVDDSINFYPTDEHILELIDLSDEWVDMVIDYFELTKDDDGAFWLVHFISDMDASEFPKIHEPINFKVYKEVEQL